MTKINPEYILSHSYFFAMEKQGQIADVFQKQLFTCNDETFMFT